jgi:hypothetical protein
VTLSKTAPLLAAIAFSFAGCAPQQHQPSATAQFMAAEAQHEREVNDRKDEVIRQLATCESGGFGPSDRPIYGGRGAYVGRLQFAPRTVMTYQKRRDGTQLSFKEASDLALDYDRAADLAKFIIFELGETAHWPLCARKIGLSQQIRDIQSL